SCPEPRVVCGGRSPERSAAGRQAAASRHVRMPLKPATQAHLEQAERHRAVAAALQDPGQVSGLQPPPLEWAAVAAFYAAVHYVNAFVFERLGQSPRDHRVRRGLVVRAAELRAVAGAYDTLFDLGWHALHAGVPRYASGGAARDRTRFGRCAYGR